MHIKPALDVSCPGIKKSVFFMIKDIVKTKAAQN